MSDGPDQAFADPAPEETPDKTHPRTIGWFGTTALGLGGLNRCLLLLPALLAAQGSAAIPLLIVGVLLAWAALPGWTELVMMWPDRVGGIAATSAEAFKPYSPVLGNLTGTCYWWGWVPTCGLTAILSASALHQWYLPAVPVRLLAAVIVVVCLALNLVGLRRVTRVAVVIGAGAATLAFASAIIPVVTNHVDWRRATSFHLVSPFHGVFGGLTSAMAGLYLIGAAAPAFEAAACHVGETVEPRRNVVRAMFSSAGIATAYLVVLPVVWLGVLGPQALTGHLATVLGPTFGPLFGSGARAAAVWFMVLNMFHGTLTPLAGASRTLSQLSDDGLLPRVLAKRSRTDVPWVATLATAGMAIAFLVGGSPMIVIAAANFTYLIGIALPSVAVWLLRRNEPMLERPYRAPRLTIGLGVFAALMWGVTTVFGFEQFGLPTVLFGLAMASSGAVAYGLRVWRERRRTRKVVRRSLHLKLTGAMVAILTLDAAGYLVAISSVGRGERLQSALLQDIFVAVALVTVGVGLVLPGMIAHAASQVSIAADRLAHGTLADLTRAMEALSAGDLDAARARVYTPHLVVQSTDEVGAMAHSFNTILDEAARAAGSLDGARAALRRHRDKGVSYANQQAAVAALGREALACTDLASLLEEAAETAARAIEVEQVTLIRYDAESNTVTPEYGSGWPASFVPTSATLAPDEPAAVVVETSSPLTIEDLSASGDVGRDRLSAAFGAHGGAWVPVTVRHETYGFLAVHSSRPRLFTPDEIHFLEAVANVIGATIDRYRTQEELIYQALHDPLTNLPNRALFHDRLSQALARLSRHPGMLAVLFVDVDRFKVINDSLGHDTGDEILAIMTERLRASIRPADTVARFGGDEFVILCEELESEADAISVAERIRQATEDPIAAKGSEFQVTVSTGIAIADRPGVSPESLVRDADAAMYEAKAGGRARFAVFADALRHRAVHRLDTEMSLRRAISNDELRVHYQPLVEITGGRVCGVEALVRWEHPEHGLIPPHEFIGLAEETGLVIPLGSWVLGEACRQLAASRREAGVEDLHVSVNLSGRQFGDPELTAVVAEALSKAELPPQSLCLEITESVLMDDADATASTLADLKALGLRLAVDDFGTGYSSLSSLKRFPVDVLKIDQAFVSGLKAGSQDAAIVAAVVALAEALQLGVVAEGVETELQLSELRQLGCGVGQGYLFSRPVCADDALRLLAPAGGFATQVDVGAAGGGDDRRDLRADELVPVQQGVS